MPLARAAVARVRDYRIGNIPAKGKGAESIKAPGISSLALAESPTAFHVTVLPDTPFLVLPRVSSEKREYAAIGLMNPPAVPSDAVTISTGATPEMFAVLTSAMHMAWLRSIGGRLKSDYRYSIGLVYNTFPMPPAKDLAALASHAQAILDARANHPGATLADLYDRDLMPADLRRAHHANDRAVDRLYRRAAFASESDRVTHLLGMYEQQVAGMLAAQKQKKPRRKATEKADEV